VERDVTAANAVRVAHDMCTQSGFEAWVAPHWSVMVNFAARLVGSADREDVAQDALALAWRRRDVFDPRRGSARSWLLALVADQARKSHRRALRARQPARQAVLASDAHVDREVDVARAIGRLSARQKLAVDLYYFFDLPIVEVAAIMGCTQGTAKSTLADARARLRDYLGDELP
jgi:RNA polymerase sigma-70 factor (ECF subfamily)